MESCRPKPLQIRKGICDNEECWLSTAAFDVVVYLVVPGEEGWMSAGGEILALSDLAVTNNGMRKVWRTGSLVGKAG